MSTTKGSPVPVPPPASSRSGSSGTLLLGLAVVLLAAAGFYVWQKGRSQPWQQTFKVVATYPHDPEAYTQGLVFDHGQFHESTGQRGHSSVRTVEIETGKVLQKTDLAPRFFGEGLAQVGDKLFQITWEEGVARVYDKATLKPLNEFQYEGEGWGLAYDGKYLIMTDKSEVLTFREPETFKEVRRVRVMSRGAPLLELNELEMVEGELWANVWKKDYIARIDPSNGEVLGFIDFTGIFDRHSIASDDAVLNGIAYDPESKRLFVTGKLWPKLFEVQIVPK